MVNFKGSTISKCGLVLIVFFLINGCAEKPQAASAEQASAAGVSYAPEVATEVARRKSAQSRFMAYQHNLSIELEKTRIPEKHSELISLCQTDTQYSCVILNSNLNSGEYQSSHMSLRLTAEGVAHFSNLAGEGGAISSRTSQAKDLGGSIQDNAKRLEMATQYRDKLLLLEAKQSDDIDALVKIASELAKVQSQLEFANGERAKLFKQVETEQLTINLSSPRSVGFWAPISESFEDFSDDFSYGISDVISSSASIIPWFVFIVILLLILRSIFRFFRIKK